MQFCAVNLLVVLQLTHDLEVSKMKTGSFDAIGGSLKFYLRRNGEHVMSFDSEKLLRSIYFWYHVSSSCSSFLLNIFLSFPLSASIIYMSEMHAIICSVLFI